MGFNSGFKVLNTFQHNARLTDIFALLPVMEIKSNY